MSTISLYASALENVSAPQRKSPFERGSRSALHPRAIALQRFNDGGVGLGEVCLGLRIGGGGEGARHIVLEEADVAVDLLERDLGVNVRRVLEVRAGVLECLRNQLLALNRGAEPYVYGARTAAP